MISIVGIFIGAVTLVFIYALCQARKVYNARSHLTKWIPQVPGSFYFGAKTEFGASTERLADLNRLLNNPKKSVYLEYLNRWIVLTRDYDLMEFLFTSSEQITKGTNYKNVVPWLGNGLLINDGQKWKTRRRIITPAFYFSILEQFVDIFNSNEDIMIEKLKREAVGKKGIEIYSYVTNCALDIICETAMGVKMGSQQNKNKTYTDAVKDMCEIVTVKSLSLWKNWDWLFPLSYEYKRQKEKIKTLHGFTNSVIEKRKEELKNRNKDITKVAEVEINLGRKRKNALLDLLLESTETENPLSQEDIREEVDTFMFAGHDTTSSAVTSGLMLLADRPEIQMLIRNELYGILENDRDRPLTYQDLQKMTYLELVAKEILRMLPPVPLIARQITKDVTYKDHIIPKDTVISMFLYGINRDSDFHEDPDKFNPDRFLNQNIKAYSSVPFSAGPRNCIVNVEEVMQNDIYQENKDHTYTSTGTFENDNHEERENTETNVSSEQYIVAEDETLTIVEPSKNHLQKGDWSKITPKFLKKPKLLVLQTPSGTEGVVKTQTLFQYFRKFKNKRNVKKMQQWVASKTIFENTKKNCIIKEHQVKMELLRKEPAKKLEVLELEYQDRKKKGK